jgi:hypothetical protein
VTWLELLAHALTCGTALGVAWIVAERWYAHRDRSYQRLVASTEIAARIAINDVVVTASKAATQLDERASKTLGRVDTLEGDVQRLLEIEQERAKGAAYGRRG